MKNLVVLNEQAYGLFDVRQSCITSVWINSHQSEFCILTADGILCLYSIDVGGWVVCFKQSWNVFVGESDHGSTGWFDVIGLLMTSSVVCLSKSGDITSLNLEGDIQHNCFELVGNIEGGIAAAKWSPDQTSLLIITNNNTVIHMSNTWEVLNEIPIAQRFPGSPCHISWRGDGDGCAILTIDEDDRLAKVRIYNKDLDILSTSRNIGEGDQSVMKGVGDNIAYATNGSYIAVSQERLKGKLQVALLERNGLRHGDFDIKIPNYQNQLLNGWKIVGLEWDSPCSLLVVSLEILEQSAALMNQSIGAVQMYYRSNFKWYLKQQWVGPGVRFHGFDPENITRCYISRRDTRDMKQYSILNIVDLSWEITSDVDSQDCSVAVFDGSNILMTPLGRCLIPPPMSKYTLSTGPTTTRQATFWKIIHLDQSKSEGCQPDWGLGCLKDDNQIVKLFFGKNSSDEIISDCSLDIYHLWTEWVSRSSSASNDEGRSMLDGISFRSLLITSKALPSTSEGDSTSVEVDVMIQFSTLCDVRSSEPNPSCPEDGVMVFKLIILIGRLESESSRSQRMVASLQSTLHAALSTSVHLNHLTNPSPSARKFSYLIPIRSKRDSFLIGNINSADNSFDLIKVDQSDNLSNELLHSLPEPCLQTIVVQNPVSPDTTTPSSNHPSYVESLVLSLSNRNRLYCNDTLIRSGVSSMLYHQLHGVLMFITFTNKPQLHYVTFESLCRCIAFEGDFHPDYLIECGEPRPLERGARLIAVVPHDSKVIIQMPRGNLEAFEPRPLILMKVQQLINRSQLVETLQLLRRQRIDLNYLFDYRPELFCDHIQSFTEAVMTFNPDHLSLFITALTSEDVTVSKYHLVRGYDGQSLQQCLESRHKYLLDQHLTGDDKVNAICKGIREALLSYISDHEVNLMRLQPLLCTYAKQKPPLLEEALQSISRLSSGLVTIQQSALKYLAFLVEGDQLFEAALGQYNFQMARAIARQCGMDPKVYIPLIESFESIGKDSAKDLLDESSSRSWKGLATMKDYLMHCKVNLHLKRWMKVVERCLDVIQEGVILNEAIRLRLKMNVSDPQSVEEWGSTFTNHPIDGIVVVNDVMNALMDRWKAFNQLYSTPNELLGELSSLHGNIMIDLHFAMDTLTTVVQGKEDLLLHLIPLLNRLELQYLSSSSSPSIPYTATATTSSISMIHDDDPAVSMYHQQCVEIVKKKVLRTLRQMYALHCVSKMQYSEAIQLYLSMDPPDPKTAIQTAIKSGDWQLALIISSRFASRESSSLPGGGETISPVATAQAIVNEFRESLQADNIDFGEWTVDSNSLDDNPLQGNESFNEASDKIVEAARLCLDYVGVNQGVGDVESAINILVMGHRWRYALEISLRYSRMDLFDEVGMALREVATELIQLFLKREKSYQDLIKQIEVLWSDPKGRLEKISSTDTLLFDELNGQPHDGNEDMADTSSEYSAMTKMSMVSYQSTDTASTVLSIQSSSTTVSVLSSISKSNRSETAPSIDAFSVEGLDHSLLSRGKVGKNPSSSAPKRRKDSERYLKRRERGKIRGLGRDVWGLKNELEICERLLSYSLTMRLVLMIKQLMDGLMVLTSTLDLELCRRLQSSMDHYIRSLQDHSPLYAPNYPHVWLDERSMSILKRFQGSFSFEGEDGQEHRIRKEAAVSLDYKYNHQKNLWWNVTAVGIKQWFHVRKISFVT